MYLYLGLMYAFHFSKLKKRKKFENELEMYNHALWVDMFLR